MPSIPVVDDSLLNAQLTTALQQTQQFRSQLEQLASRLASRRETMRLTERIAADSKPLFEGIGLSRMQYLKPSIRSGNSPVAISKRRVHE